MDKNNILLITNNDYTRSVICKNLVLLRQNDEIDVCDYSAVKKTLGNSLYSLIILHESEDEDTTLKLIKTIEQIKSNAEILLLLNQKNQKLTVSAYDNGISDFIYITDEPFEMLIKAVNCLKYNTLKGNYNNCLRSFENLKILDSKTGFFEYKFLKEIFVELSDDERIKNGFFTILTLDEKVKTKVSTNRLALMIKNNKRADDITAVARGGKFYVIQPNTDFLGAKEFINKIQAIMGDEFCIRAGMSKIGIYSFETLDKNAGDGLISATQNDLHYVCLENTKTDTWLSGESEAKNTKKYKLFYKLFKEKFDNTITPLFYRYQKEYETKLTNTLVSQYANDIESVFCLKNNNVTSELIIRYNGYAKFYIEISHSGLNSAENTKIELPINEMDDKYLISLLKKLKNEYKQSNDAIYSAQNI